MSKRRTFLKTSLLLSPVVAFPQLVLSRQIKDLPRVLIIGDSISIGYTPFVQEYLRFSAEVVRPTYEDGRPENCEGTTKGVTNIKRWIGDTSWDVIHFNFGLHDIKHVDPATGKNSDNPGHPQQADLKRYKKNLTEIVGILKTTGAKLIFATTTPYPDEVDGPLRKPGMPQQYNKTAIKIMNRNNITINDLYLFAEARLNEIQRPRNVHFTEEGSKALARKVADRIEEALVHN